MGLGEIIWKATGGSTMYCALAITGQEPSQTDDLHYGDFVELAAGSGYTTGGAAMTLINASVPSSHQITFDAADTLIGTACSFTARYAIPYKQTTSYPLWSYHDFGSTAGAGGNYTIVWNSGGVSQITVAAGA